MRRISILGMFLIPVLIISGCRSAARHPGVFAEDFEKGRLDLSRWEVTHDGDFAEAVVDVVDLAPDEHTDHRLRLRASTIGTSDPLKFLGVRSRSTIDFSTPKTITFDLDWNNQSNGSYLTASFYICPTASQNPRAENDWLKFEYVGVPPGRNVRVNIRVKEKGVLRPLLMDWGPRDEEGRPLGKPLGLTSHRINIFLDKNRMRFIQDKEEIFPLTRHNLNFTKAHIYLQMSCGTNYPSREVYFDNIIVRHPSSAIFLP